MRLCKQLYSMKQDMNIVGSLPNAGAPDRPSQPAMRLMSIQSPPRGLNYSKENTKFLLSLYLDQLEGHIASTPLNQPHPVEKLSLEGQAIRSYMQRN